MSVCVEEMLKLLIGDVALSVMDVDEERKDSIGIILVKGPGFVSRISLRRILLAVDAMSGSTLEWWAVSCEEVEQGICICGSEPACLNVDDSMTEATGTSPSGVSVLGTFRNFRFRPPFS